MLGLTIMFGLTVATSILTWFNFVMWNEWSSRTLKAIAVLINIVFLVATAAFWIALADGISREAYICKHYATKV